MTKIDIAPTTAPNTSHGLDQIEPDDVSGTGLWVIPALAGAAVVGTGVGMAAAGGALAVAYGAGYVAGAATSDDSKASPKAPSGT